MSDLTDIIRAEIAREGAIPFARFMELALYCPNFGYYERADVSPGRKGDFYTSVSVGPLFGELLANQFAEWMESAAACGRRNEAGLESEVSNLKPKIQDACQIVEAGAHDGRLALDILKWLKAEREELFGKLEYWLIEPSPHRKRMQEKTLAGFKGSVRWFESWEQVPESGINGVIFSNELLDAMPVHRLGWDADKKEWFEWSVSWSGKGFVWTREFKIQNSKFKIEDYFGNLPRELLDVLPDGFTTEICPAAMDWSRKAARALNAGKLVTIDYGLKAEQFFTPGRNNGTLRAYHRHHQTSDLLAQPGEQDLTAQVNFSAIQKAGESEGLKTERSTTQRQFLTAIIEKNCCHNPTIKEWTSSRIRQFQTLTHPEHLGQLFQVLVQKS